MLRHSLAVPWLFAWRLGRALGGGAPGGFRIILLHHIPPHLMDVFDRFVAHVAHRHGLVAPADAARWVDGETPAPADRQPCLLSFDDGFDSNHTAAMQVLARHGAKALFFVCPDLVDIDPEDQPEHLAGTIFDDGVEVADDRRLMSWEQIAELAAAGHTIGAHGMSHRRLSQLSGRPLEYEVVRSGQRIEERLSAPVEWFAYPFGDIDSISMQALEVIDAHYRFCRSGVRGANTAATPRHALRADHVDLAAPAAWAALAIEGGLDFRYAERRRRLDAMLEDHEQQAASETGDRD